MEKAGKKISELRVVDLRQILEKRGLEKSGNKSILIERLSKSLTDEGHDPNTYIHTLEEHEDVGNDSQLSETSHVDEEISLDNKTEDCEAANAADSAEPSESNETINEDQYEIPVETVDQQTVEEKESPLHEEQMMEVDSLVPEQSETSNNLEVSAETESAVATSEETKPVVAVIDEETAADDSTHSEHVSGNDCPVNTKTLTPNKSAESLVDSSQVPDKDKLTTEDESGADTAPLDIDTEKSVNVASAREKPGPEGVVSADSVASDSAVNATGNTPPPTSAALIDTEDQLVVHVDESDTNLDYDLGDKPEERDAPTPTKDESMDVDAGDIVQSGSATTTDKQTEKSVNVGATTGQDSKSTSDARTDTPKKDAKDLAASQNLWISGLSSLTRATDLKAVFSKHGKVIGAKVVTNANRPGAKCYGYVTMSCSEEAAKCIQNLHRTDLHGRMISVEKAKSDPAAQARAAAARKPASSVEDKKKDETSTPTAKESSSATADERAKADSHRVSHSEDKARHGERHRPVRPPQTGPAKKESESTATGEKKPEEKDKKTEAERKAEELLEREKRKLRVQERRARDEDYRRRTTLMNEKRKLADQQRRLRQEDARIEREREKLRLDKEKVKIEEMKLVSLQAERIRLENQLIDLRQRVDRERDELKRVETLRLEEMRRSSAVKRPYEVSGGGRSSGGGRYEDNWESKRPVPNDRYSSMNVRSSAVSGDRGVYSDRRVSDMERRAVAVKEVVVDSRSGRADDRYSRGSGSDRREYAAVDGRARESSRTDWKQSDSRGTSRSYHDSSSRRSGGSGDRSGGSWGGSGGSSGAPSLLTAPSGNDLFSGAAVEAAGMMMNAAMNRSSNTNGTSSSRYSGGGSSGGSGYSGARRY